MKFTKRRKAWLGYAASLLAGYALSQFWVGDAGLAWGLYRIIRAVLLGSLDYGLRPWQHRYPAKGANYRLSLKLFAEYMNQECEIYGTYFLLVFSYIDMLSRLLSSLFN